MMGTLGFILASQLHAPMRALNLPSLKPIRVDSAVRYPRDNNQDTRSIYDSLLMSDIDMLEDDLGVQPERLVIKGSTEQGSFTIWVDLEENVIGYANWNDLCYRPYEGSGSIGMMIFGTPGLLISSPIWMLTQSVWKFVEQTVNMDHHTWILWMKLRSQLNERDGLALKDALVNHCNGFEQKYFDRKYGNISNLKNT